MFIENWRSAHKLYTVQLGLALSVVSFIEANSAAVAAALPPAWQGYLGVAIAVARVIRQNMVSQESTDPKEPST